MKWFGFSPSMAAGGEAAAATSAIRDSRGGAPARGSTFQRRSSAIGRTLPYLT